MGSPVSSETMFDLATRDLPASGLDPATSWQLAERLWFASRAGSGGAIYTCALPDTDSCASGSWYQQMRAADDDDGATAAAEEHAEEGHDEAQHGRGVLEEDDEHRRVLPPLHGLDVAGRNVSCDEIGGDYFDFLWRRENPDGPFSVVVGDITGHGVDSALLMTSARAFLRMRASQPGTISDIVGAMNSHLTQDVLETGRFMTLFYLTVDPQKNRIDWVRAGHDPALLYDPQQDAFEELKGTGMALGVNDAFKYPENRHEGLTNGQIIAIGTDGIWEATNREGQMFGKERFRSIIRKNSHAAAGDILHAVYHELNQFTRGQRSEDDITLVVIKIDGIG